MLKSFSAKRLFCSKRVFIVFVTIVSLDVIYIHGHWCEMGKQKGLRGCVALLLFDKKNFDGVVGVPIRQAQGVPIRQAQGV